MLKILFTAFLLATPSLASPPNVAPELEALGIRPVISKKVDPRFKNLSHEEDRYFLEVKLGKLTRAQFDGARALYGNQSQVPFDANRNYELIDFLPPFIQATANQVFLAKYGSATDALRDIWGERDSADQWAILKNGLASFTNCWNTTLEILRSQHPRGGSTAFLYWPGRWDTSDVFQNEAFMRPVPAREARIGDVLLISLILGFVEGESEGGPMLQHTAYLVASGLVFERTDSSDNDPYRISFRSDVEKKYRRLFKDEKFRIETRRMVGPEFPSKPSYIDFSDRSAWVEGDEALLQKNIPGFNTKRLVVGCETGMGGGCDMMTSEVLETKLITDPRTGRGILQAPRAVLDRFQPLRAR